MNDTRVALLHDPKGQVSARRRLLARQLDELQALELRLAELAPSIKKAASIEGVVEEAHEQALFACELSASIARIRLAIENALNLES